MREVAPVLAWVVNATEAFPVPLDGDALTQSGVVTTHVLFEVTDWESATTPALGLHGVPGDNVNVAAPPAWVTTKVPTPASAVMVITPILGSVEGLAVTETLT